MKCIVCGKSNEKSVCSDFENKKRCKVCNILKTDFYKYRNGKLYLVVDFDLVVNMGTIFHSFMLNKNLILVFKKYEIYLSIG